MKLELKHLAPYLPYELKIPNRNPLVGTRILDSDIENSDEIVNIGACIRLQYKPILRPLSDLTPELLKELRDSENKDLLLWGVRGFEGDLTSCNKYSYELTYHVLEWLYKNHIDVFGLIDAGLAIDINTL